MIQIIWDYFLKSSDEIKWFFEDENNNLPLFL